MIGAVVYRLRAEGAARVPVFHGRWLHGLFFKLMEEYSPELSAYVHEGLNVKPFTVSLLKGRWGKEEGGCCAVAKGETLRWRVTALREDVLQAALHVRAGDILQAGHLTLRVEAVKVDGTEDSGVVDEMELVGAALASGRMAELRLRFLSPVAFRRDDKDYPMPDPVFILSFSGRFNYDVTALDEEEQHALLLLAQFATFSGVGRLTGQGFGETRVAYR